MTEIGVRETVVASERRFQVGVYEIDNSEGSEASIRIH